MTDQLQAFIRQNRQAFDTAEPDKGLWRNTERLFEQACAAQGAERFVLLNRPLLDTAEPPPGVWENIEKQLDGRASGDDPLETFIRQNRTGFDSVAPDPRLWADIEKAVAPRAATPSQPPLRISWTRQLLRVAAALALLVTGAGLGIWYQSAGHGPSAGMKLGDVSAEYAELESFYRRDISDKQQKLVAFTANQGADVAEDLHQLDDVMADLQRELASVPPGNREQVVRAMIENYKAKAAILERVLERVEGQQSQPKTKINDSNETESI